ncbi:LamG-like jellyroll fold domain-containing protein [Planctomycetaceae bacterium SH139]
MPKRQKRRMLLEGLEQRQMLTGDPLSEVQKDALIADLPALVSHAEHVDTAEPLSRPLSLVGSSFGTQFDISNVLEARFTQPLAQHIQDNRAGLTVEDVTTFLNSESIEGTFGDLQVTVGETTGRIGANGELVFATSFYATRSVEYEIAPGTAAAELGLKLADGANSFSQVDLGFEFEFQFGVDTAGEFFTEVETLDLVVDQESDAAPELDYGLLGLSVESGEIVIDAALTVATDSGDDARLSASELRSSPELTLSSSGSANAAWFVQPAAEGSLLISQPMIELNDTDLFGESPLDVMLVDFDELDQRRAEAAASLTSGFSALTTLGERLEETSPFATQLPGFNVSAAETIDFDAALREQLEQPVRNLLTINPNATWEDIAAALASVPGVTVGELTKTSSTVKLDLNIQRSRNGNAELMLGDAAADAGLAVDEDGIAELDIQGEMAWSLSIEIDRRHDVAPLDSFAVSFADLQSSAEIDADVEFSGRIGLLGIESEAGRAQLNVSLSSDSSSVFHTAAALLDQPIDSLLETSVTGSVDIHLPITATLGSHQFSASLDLQSNTPYDGEQEILPTSFAQFDDLKQFAAGDLIGGIEQLSGWFGDYAEAKLDSSIPFAGNTTLSDALSFQQIFESTVAGLLKDETDAPRFTTAQGLLDLVPAITAVDYDPASRQLVFEVEFSGLNEAIDADLDINLEVAGLAGFESNSSISLSGGATGRFKLGIDLRPLGHDFTLDTNTQLKDLNAGMGVLFDADKDPETNDQIEVSLRSGESFIVNFDALNEESTIADVIDTIHAAQDAAGIPAADFTVALREEDGQAVGLQMTDGSENLDREFTIVGIGGSLVGVGLGIVGADEDGDGVIEGKVLHGDSFVNHLYLERTDQPLATGRIDLSGDLSGSVNLGFVSSAITAGTVQAPDGGPAFLQADIDLIDPATGDIKTRMTLGELFQSLDPNETEVAAEAAIGGALGLRLPVSATVAGVSYGGVVEVNVTEFGETFSTELLKSVDADLLDLSELSAADILDGLRDGLQQLLTLSEMPEFDISLPIINTKLPELIGLGGLLDRLTMALESVGSTTLDVIGRELNKLTSESISLPTFSASLPDLLGFLSTIKGQRDDAAAAGDSTISLADLIPSFLSHFDVDVELPDVEVELTAFDDFTDVLSGLLEQLGRSDGGSLQAIEAVLEDALELGTDGISLGLDSSQAGKFAVRFDLTVSESVNKDLPLQIDLADLNLGGIGDLIDVSGSSTLNVNAGATATLSLGLEISSTGILPFMYGYDPTTMQGTRVALSAGAAATAIEFDASLGPIGIAIAGGIAGINASGIVGDTSPASFLVSPVGAGGSRIYLGESLSLATTTSSGAYANFPIEVPRGNPITTLAYAVDDLTTPPDASAFNVAEVRAAIEAEIAELSANGIGSNLLTLVGGWEGAFDLLTDTMRGDVLGVPLPLIGDALAEEADFLDRIKNSVLNNIEDVAEQGVTFVQQGLFDALGPAGLNWLADRNSDGQINLNDVGMVLSDDFQQVDFDIWLRKAVEPVDFNVDFDLGLPGLNLDIEAPVELSFGADFRLGFGASVEDGFYLATDPARTELKMEFNAAVPDLTARGELAFLNIDATSNGPDSTFFNGQFRVNLEDTIVGELLSMNEMFANDFSELIDTTLEASAGVDLELMVNLGDSSLFPRMRTDLQVDWQFIAGEGVNAPTVDFNNVQLNLGDFFSGFAGELLRDVQDVLAPVQPVIDILSSRLPVISDLSGSSVTLVDLARLFGRADVANFLESVKTVNDLIVGLPEVGPDTWIDLGSFDIEAGGLGGYTGPGWSPGTTKPTAKIGNSSPNSDPLGQVNSKAGSQGGKWTNNLEGASGSLSFPLLQSPTSAFKLLLGQDVDLFLYDAPALGVDFSYSQFFPIPAFPILGAEIGGRIAAVADFAFGFDTTGIRKFSDSGQFGDIFDGFFVSDRANADGTGADVPEVYLRGNLRAGAKLNLLFASAGVNGGIFAGVDFNLHDNDQDGRVRGNELADNFALGPIHVFDVSGSVDARLNAYLELDFFFFSVREDYELARVNLLDFNIARPVSGGIDANELLTSRAGDVLTLKFTQQNDNYRVFAGSEPGSIVVSGQGYQTDDIFGVTKIVGNALDGDDIVTIAEDILIPVELSGGLGNDVLTAGGGAAVLRGNEGNDQLVGSGLADTLEGGAGDDTLLGGDGNDLLIGGSGHDYLDGGRNEDVLRGGDDHDVLIGGLGSDTIDGDAGNDTINGGRGNDVLRGGDGDDQISGGLGDDQIFGGGGNDTLLGEEGADRIEGGEGNDIIDGGDRNDVLLGDGGDDVIFAGAGNDTVRGGAGNDEIRGDVGRDTIHGDDGDDLIFAANDEAGADDNSGNTIYAGAGHDIVYGSAGADNIFGQAGDDVIESGEGHDVVDAGDGDDIVLAGDGDDVVVGGFGNDEIDGGAGNDLLWGGFAAYASTHFVLADQSLFEAPMRFDEAQAFTASDYVLPVLVTPKVVRGPNGGPSLSVFGVTGDGEDTLRGGDGTDWLFGGDNSDVLFGGDGADYIDAGGGDDGNVFGGDGDDVIRGGAGSDTLRGGAGIDHLYGEQGRDRLFGDEGAGGSTVGQRLFGGEGADALFAWAAGDVSDMGARGDELWGEDGNDSLYGNRRNDWLIGEAGSDFASGDWASGPNYLANPFAAFNTGFGGAAIGSDDVLLGGAGQDQLYGGGGDDRIEGGGDGDWLEGQDGEDTLLGGRGIDMLVLDVNADYSVRGGERLDGHGDATSGISTPDDNATDVVLISGTQANDFINIGQTPAGLLSVEYNGTTITAEWKDGTRALVEQFRIAGLGGDDHIEFLRGASELDFSDLIARSREFVTTIDGGSGDDTLIGSTARDRIDGGRGSDVIFGYAGDDRLWGDQGNGDGSPTDVDKIYAGAGNDDILGGQGTNQLYAWSFDPILGTAFGVFADEEGNLYDSPAEGRSLEDTGLNRIIGGEQSDQLYGGTGLDLLYGAGGDDELFTKTGELFESLDGDEAGNEWKEYARSSDHVWYVGGSNVDDVITLDFVTEPGLFQGHHLFTRSTNNNGFLTFAAEVRLDYGARGTDGELIWNANDLLTDLEDLQNENPVIRQQAIERLNNDADRLTPILPGEGDFRAIIVDALAGNDQIFIGPTVQKSVWIDAGAGDDTVQIASGRSILIDKTDAIGERNDTIATAAPLAGPAVLIGPNAAPANGRLDDDAEFFLIVDSLAEQVRVTIPAAVTDDNLSLDDLVADVNEAIANTSANGLVVATRAGEMIAFSTLSSGPQTRLNITIVEGNAASTEMGLALSELARPSNRLTRDVIYEGLTIDNPSDIDHYQFQFTQDVVDSILAGGTARLGSESISPADGIELSLFNAADGALLAGPFAAATGIDLAAIDWSAVGLTVDTELVVRVESDSIPTIYSLHFELGSDGDAMRVDLAAEAEIVRRDVIFGGSGNDRLQGGPGEDFIFGGSGNDVLTGGADQGASDLLFGNQGDDTFQSIPDALPTLAGTDTPFIPEASDRFDGGSGNDQVLYLGGDLDRRDQPINDFVSLRYNSLLHRYELTAMVWDINNQRFIPADPAVADSNVVSADAEMLREYHFYVAANVESTTVDLGAGDDTFCGDAGFTCVGDTGTEWGIGEGSVQAGGRALANLTVLGGAGSDRLYGGMYADVLDGGDGADIIIGGGGDDTIDGGSGNDFLAGNTAVAPDRFEFVAKSFGSGANDTSEFAALVPAVAGQAIGELTFHAGDQVDWYLLRPRARATFNAEQIAAMRAELVKAVPESDAAGEKFITTLLFAEPVGSESDLAFQPIDEAAGAAEYLLLRVDNQLTSEDELSTDERRYRLNFLEPLGDSIEASVQRLTAVPSDNEPANGFSQTVDQFEILGLVSGGQGSIQPIGDFNGDGQEDFIVSINERFESSDSSYYSYVRIVYGGDPILDPDAIDPVSDSGLVIGVRGALVTGDTGQTGSISGGGDVDGDGFDDLIVSGNDGNVFVIFGKDYEQIVLSVDENQLAGDRWLVIEGFTGAANASIVGNVTGDQRADLVVTDENDSHLFAGRSRVMWYEPISLLPDGQDRFHFTGTTHGFTLNDDNDQSKSVWEIEGNRLVMGGAQTYRNFQTIFGIDFELPVQAKTTSVPIDLRTAVDPVLSFDHLLQTQNTEGLDIARVQVLVDGQTTTLPGGTNQAGGILTDGMNTGMDMVNLSFSLEQFVGSIVQIVFSFDSVTNQANNFYGWAIDNVRVNGTRLGTSGPADVVIPGAATEPLGLGNYLDNADGFDDFVVLTDTELTIYQGAGSIDTAGVMSVAGDFAGSRVLSAGEIDGDGLPDLVVSGPSQSWLITRDAAGMLALTDTNVAGLRPIGDFSGDGLTDFAATVLETTSVLDTSAEANVHAVTHVYVSDDFSEMIVRLNSTTPNPHLTLEMPDALFQPESAGPGLLTRTPQFGSLGDLNGDGRDDLGLFAPLRTDLQVVFGGELVPTGNDGEGAIQPVEIAPARLATPTLTTTVTVSNAGIDVVNDLDAKLDDAALIEGLASGDGLFAARGIGDINGDGIEDAVVEGLNSSQIVLGPFAPSGVSRVDQIGNIELATRFVALGSGNLLGTESDDLYTFRTIENANGTTTTTYEVYEGGISFDRNFTATPTTSLQATVGGQPVKPSLINWDGQGSTELTLPLPQPLNSGQVGTIIANQNVRLFFNDTLINVPAGMTLNEAARFDTTVIGDINGDGKEDLAFASPNLFIDGAGRFTGATYLLLGGQTGDVQIATQADAVILGETLGASISPLGDINGDGFDDFAISRSQESSGALDGGLLIYLGRETFRVEPGVMETLTANDADLKFSRATAAQLGASSAIEGRLTATAGDLDDDGRIDLVIGAPSESVINLQNGLTTQTNNRGEVSIFFDVMSHGDRITGDTADRTLRGTTATSQAGTISTGVLRDLNDDGIDDLVIGASAADGIIGGLRQDAGHVYFVPGVRQQIELPAGDQVQVIENGDGFVVDRQTGQPLLFPNLQLEGDETWVRFTTAGDGAAVENAVDHVRLSPGSSATPITVSLSDSGMISDTGEVSRPSVLRVGGAQNQVAVAEIDLRSLADQWRETGAVPKVTLTPTVLNSDSFFAPANMGQFTSVGDQVFFTADDPDLGTSLYVSDGTTAGTRRLQMPAGADPQNMIQVGEQLFFTDFANGTANTVELWKSDGTDVGTQRILTIDGSAAGFTASDNRLYYLTANSAGQYRDLWYTSGTAESTFFIARDPEVIEFFPDSMRITESDFEVDPVVYLIGRHQDWNDPVLFASPGNNSNDPNGMFIVGDSSMGNILRGVTNPFAFDGLLAFSSFWNDNGELTVTNGVIEGNGNQIGIRYFLRGLDGNTLEPKNSHGFIVEKDAYTLQESDFFLGTSANPQEYQDWITYSVDLNRDVVYFFGESPDGEGNSIYRMYVDYVNGNMVRDDNTPNRELMQFRLRVVEIASQIGDNPRDLVMRGDELFFVVDDSSWGSEVVKVDKNFSTVPGSGQTPRLVSDINRNAGNSEPRELTVVGDQVYFTATDGVRRELYTAAPDDLTLSRFSQVPNSPAESDRLAAFGNRLSFVGGGSLWTTSGAEAAPIGNGSSPTTTLEIGLLAEAGDGLVTSADRTATLSFQQTVDLVGGEISEPIDLTDLVTTALSAGHETLTIRVEAPTEAAEHYLLPALETGERLGTLEIDVQGVVADLIDEQGYVIARDQSLHDLRNLVAGTYYLRVGRPTDSTSTDPITFGVELDAPTLGNSYPTSDRDTIRGGDGKDQILGGPGLDSLLGQEGTDTFVAEDLEVFDLNANVDDTLTAVDPADISNAPVGVPSDTVVLTGADVNPLIRKAIADALGHPTTSDADGNLVFHQPIYASQVAEIEYLDLSGLGLSSAADLNGLEHAIHLRFLDLSDNQLNSVTLPAPFNFLQTLNLANNAITNIQPGDLINTPFLRQLFVDGNDIRDLQDLAGAIIVEDGDVGYEEIGVWQNEVFTADSVWLDDYRYAKAGGTAIWNIDSIAGTDTELFVTWPTLESETPTEVTYRVMSGGTELFSRTVNQTVPVGEYNAAAEFGGTDWLSLGTFTAGASGLRVELVADVDVVVAADAVRAEAILVPTTSLDVVSLLGNPINDVSRDEWISRIEAGGDGPSLIVTPNANAPTINPIEPQKLHHGSLLFDDSAVTLPGELLDGRESFMFESWFRPSQANITDQFILSAGGSSTSNEFFVTHLSNTVIRIGDQDAFFDFTVPSTIDLTNGEWHHYAVARDLPTRKLRLFIDGQYIGERNLPTSASAMRVAPDGLYLGQDQDEIGGNYNSVQGLRGELDEVRFWDRFWDYAESENHLAAQLKSVLVLKDREARGFDRLLAYYQFDELDGNQVLDGSVNGWHGELGDLIGNEDRDIRPAPLRSENAPILETHRFNLPITGNTDLDGEFIRYSAISDNPSVIATTSGQSMVVEYPANVPQSARITVTAFDENGREARTGFDFVVGSQVGYPVGDITTSTILTFDGGFSAWTPVNQDYGDRVIASTMGTFSYGGGSNGPNTPNITVDYGPNINFYDNDFGGLVNVLWATSDLLETTLVADPGYQVGLHGFDLAFYLNDYIADTIEVFDGSGNVLFVQNDVLIEGQAGERTSFTFPTALVGEQLTIRLDSRNEPNQALGIDNIQFSQAFIGATRVNQTTHGTVYFDADESGSRDAGERGVGGMVLHLLDAAGNGIACSVTDTNGNYRINADLANLVHSIELELPSGWNATSPTTVPIGNRAPDMLINFGISKPINIGADRAGTEGTLQSFTVDSSLTLNSFAWVVTLDGNQVAEGNTTDFDFTPENEGNYIVKLTAVDDSDTAHTDSLLLRVAGAPPVATLNFVGDPVSSIDEGTTLEFNATVSDAGASDTIAAFKWFALGSFGQEVGSFSGNLTAGEPVPNWSFEFVAEGNYQILLQLTDNEGLSGVSAPISIAANNVAPVAMLTQSTTTTSTGEVSFSGSFVDPGQDFWTGRADFGDGNIRPIVVRSDKTIEGEYQYTEPGRYTVSVEMDDNDGGTSLNTFEVIYDPFAPQRVNLVGRIDEHIDTTAGPIYVGTLDVEDSTTGDGHFLQLVDGSGDDDNIRFMIDGQVLRLKQGEVVDFEVRSEYGIRVRATDHVGNQVESEIKIKVEDLPEVAPANIDYLEIGNTVLDLWGDQSGQYDQIRHDGSATLGGTLEIRLADEFAPSLGDSFNLISVTGEMTGRFDEVMLPEVASGYAWSLVYENQQVRLDLLSIATINSVTINGGEAQRSQVRSMDILFAGPVDVDTDAFTIERTVNGEQFTVENTFVLIDDGSGNTIARLTFSGTSTRNGGSLLDGDYRLVVDADKVRRAGSDVLLDGDGDGQAGGDFVFGESATDNFFAFYGDSDGDRAVDLSDFIDFRSTFGKTEADEGFDEIFDYQDDGAVDLLDFIQFRARFGSTL